MDIKTFIGETTEYDKKEMLETKKPKSWLKSVSAFANGIGGTLVFGITDNDEVIGLKDAESDAETISEQIKTKLDPIPEVNLRFHETEDGKKLILLQVYPGKETPYYYIGDGSRLTFIRIGNESVTADRAALKRLVLKGSGISFDSLPSQYKFKNMAFSKIRSEHEAFFITLWNLNYYGTKNFKDVPKVSQSVPEVIQSVPEQLKLLIKANPSISRAELSKQLMISERQVRKIIDQLRSNGTLKREGGDYNGKWLLTE